MQSNKYYPPHWKEKGPPGLNSYKRGCHCEECTRANTDNQNNYRRVHGRKSRMSG